MFSRIWCPFVLAIFLAAGAPVAAQETGETPAEAPEPGPMLDIREATDVQAEDFLWQNRLIVVIADTPRDPRFQEQMDELLSRPGELIIRDVVVIIDTDPAAKSALRERLRPSGFSLVFIDKDGVIKLRKPLPWSVREIVRSIDKTELRQQEIRDATMRGRG